MGEAPMTAADVGAVLNGRGYDQNGMGGMGWIFGLIVLLAIFNGGFGGGWGNNRGGMDVVTNADLCNANNFTQLENAVGRISDSQAAIARQTDNAICNLGYTELQNTMGTREIIQNCCCDIKTLMQQEFRALEQRDSARVEAELRAELADVKSDVRFCGIPRFGFTYNVNPSVLYGNGCNGSCGNNVLF